jgi:hypothetical protein
VRDSGATKPGCPRTASLHAFVADRVRSPRRGDERSGPNPAAAVGEHECVLVYTIAVGCQDTGVVRGRGEGGIKE